MSSMWVLTRFNVISQTHTAQRLLDFLLRTVDASPNSFDLPVHLCRSATLVGDAILEKENSVKPAAGHELELSDQALEKVCES